jgi:large subunit ribosomal protein L23
LPKNIKQKTINKIMAILNIFKKQKKVEKKVKKEKKVEKKVKLKAKPKEIKVEKPLAVSVPKIKEKKSGFAWKVLKTPHITEKASDLAEKNQYIFNVFPQTNKAQIKKAIEDLFGVEAVSVKIINVLAKKRRLGRISGFKSGYKKAIVKIKEGQKIEIMPR